jgi:hypothetical protein
MIIGLILFLFLILAIILLLSSPLILFYINKPPENKYIQAIVYENTSGYIILESSSGKKKILSSLSNKLIGKSYYLNQLWMAEDEIYSNNDNKYFGNVQNFIDYSIVHFTENDNTITKIINNYNSSITLNNNEIGQILYKENGNKPIFHLNVLKNLSDNELFLLTISFVFHFHTLLKEGD